ncbi:MAG: bifunctional phosphoglucose/phosphomannose isomerase [Bacteroidia bacterium]
MKDLIAGFPNQLKEALKIYSEAKLPKAEREIHSVLITGLGGSGIGGNIVSELVASQSPVPVVVSKDYSIPAWAKKHTLVIVSSYSGNTEETLHAMKEACERDCMITCITSGGEVLDIAKEKSLPFIKIPGGNPPRACLGYSLVQICGIMQHHGLASGLINELDLSALLIENNQTSIKAEAEAIAGSISYSLPVIYTSNGYEGIAIRFRQQLNENAKMLCWHHVIPEMNHNELVGWVDKAPSIAAIFLRNSDEYYRTARRMDIVKSIVYKLAGRTIVIESKGRSHLQRCIWWIHLGDWISWFASEERNVDAVEINVINQLKSELSQLE